MTANLTYKRHAELVARMADARGVDLELSIMKGRLQISSLGDAVLNCTGCANPEACEGWLSAQDGEAQASPSYCRNADLFDVLKKGGRA